MIIPIILSGGNGTRLWPLSRKSKPKQFIDFSGDGTMFTQTIKRFKNKKIFGDPIILGNVDHEKLIDAEVKKNKLKDSKIILEPKAKNTAPAIAGTIEYLHRKGMDDEVVVFLPSDAYIDNDDEFRDYLLEGMRIANENKIVVFGIKPLYPETGYGYIKLGKKIKENSFVVDKFVEKPDMETAIEFLKAGRYLWNAGIFMTKVSVLRDLFLKFQKNLMKNIETTIEKSIEKGNKFFLNNDTFVKSEEISVDYAVIENLDSSNLAVISMNLIWSDLGSFKSLHDLNTNKTKDNNIVMGKVVLHNSENCYIKSYKKIICCTDVDDLVIVEDKDVILVMKKDKSQNVKKIIEKCKELDLKGIL